MTDYLSPPRTGTAVFAWRDGKFLMIRRGLTGCGPGTWGLPGGRMEPGEHWEDTAARELHEETRLTASSAPRWRGITNDPCHCGEHWLTIWLDIMSVSGEPVITEEATELRWCTMDTLPSPLFEPQFRNFLASCPHRPLPDLRCRHCDGPAAACAREPA
jgi:ADP-ribose pyrophosphatase YjhB (NUDIX family)